MAETSTDRSRATLRFMAAPTDVMHPEAGGVQGGRLLEWIDKSAYACAAQWAQTYCVTGFLGDVEFGPAIPSGSIVEVRSRLASTGRSSMQVISEIHSADPKVGDYTRNAVCFATFIAKNADKTASQPVEAFTPTTPVEQQAAEAIATRLQAGKAVKELLGGSDSSQDIEAPRTVLRFMAKPTDINWGGNVHGGKAMEWVDEASSACAGAFVGGPVAPAHWEGVRFLKPMHIGDVIEVDARVVGADEDGVDLYVVLRASSPYDGKMRVALTATTRYRAVNGEVPGQLAVDTRVKEKAAQVQELIAPYAVQPLWES